MISKPLKKFKVLIRLVVVRRDYATYGLLKNSLEKSGCKVLVVSSLNYTLALKYWKPDAVIVHTLTSGETAKKILPSVKIFFLDVEGFRPEDQCHAVFFLKQKNLIENFSLFLFWGEQVIKEFKKIAPNLDRSKIRIVGNPKLDFIRFLKNENIKVKENKKIGILTRFHVLNNHIGRPVIFSLANNPGKYKYTDTQMKTFLAMIKVVNEILKNTDFKISIRVHPFEAVEGYENNLKRWFGQNNLSRFEIDDSLDFTDWVRKQNVVITPSSAAITECYLLDIPVINIDKIAKVVEYNKSYDQVVTDWFEGAFLPSNIKELIKLLKTRKVKKKNKTMDQMLKKYCDWHKGDYATKNSHNHIVNELNYHQKNFFNISMPFFLIKLLLSIKDRLSFFKNPLLKNFNYSEHVHKQPSTYSKIINKMFGKGSF